MEQEPAKLKDWQSVILTQQRQDGLEYEIWLSKLPHHRANIIGIGGRGPRRYFPANGETSPK